MAFAQSQLERPLNRVPRGQQRRRWAAHVRPFQRRAGGREGHCVGGGDAGGAVDANDAAVTQRLPSTVNAAARNYKKKKSLYSVVSVYQGARVNTKKKKSWRRMKHRTR